MAFDRGVRARTVTLDGDSFEPQGTLTGGSKSQLGVILGRLAELQSASRELGVHEERLRGVTEKIGRLSAVSKKVRCFIVVVVLVGVGVGVSGLREKLGGCLLFPTRYGVLCKLLLLFFFLLVLVLVLVLVLFVLAIRGVPR